MLTIDLLPPGLLDTAFREDARAGLTAAPKSLPSKWSYDANGNALFNPAPRTLGVSGFLGC